MVVFQQAMDAKAPRPWILLLQVPDLFEKREGSLIVGMGEGRVRWSSRPSKPSRSKAAMIA